MKIAWAEDAFVDNGAQARQEEGPVVSWHRRLGVRLRLDMDAEGAKAVSLRWIDTDKGDVGRREIKEH